MQTTTNEGMEEWVTLDLRLVNWNYMNFKLRVRTDTHLFSINKKIEERHGRITALKICRDQFSERTQMTDEMQPLHAYGIQGAGLDDPEHVVLLYYDFKLCDHENPLLLAT